MIKILDFYAVWCKPCIMMSNILGEIKKELDVEIEEIKIDENDEMTEQYGVRSIPTLIFLKDNIQVARQNGLVTKDKLITLLKQLNID